MFFFSFRTLKSFEAWLRKGGKGTDYLLYPEMAVMMNVIIDCKNRVSEKPRIHPCVNLHPGKKIRL